jgi:hypothetical protein
VFLIAANARELPVFYRDGESAIARTEDAGGFLGDLAGFGSHLVAATIYITAVILTIVM